jgi:hypothetical protein
MKKCPKSAHFMEREKEGVLYGWFYGGFGKKG